jgi:peptidoglycan/xylan/chitin deacetylase (PgdA/CDA1 family)
MMEKGCLVISLDFELTWGAIDTWLPDGYGNSNILQVREVVKRLIALFEKYEVKATFATVGFVMLRDVDDIKQHTPDSTPTYNNEALRPYGKYLDYVEKQDRHLFFAPELVELLKMSSNVEIGTHTFGHFYCWEAGQTIEQFDADIVKAQKVGEKQGIKLESIVFPRNQVSDDYLEVCAKHGIKTYRGNAKKYFDHTTNRWKVLYNKVSRLLDAYVNWGGNTSISYSGIDGNAVPMNVPASRMLRPYMHKLRWLEGMRLRRIKKEMLYTAKHHELYHLWWHPHNFGADMDKNFAFLEEVLKCYKVCHAEFGMESMTMKEFYYKFNDK